MYAVLCVDDSLVYLVPGAQVIPTCISPEGAVVSTHLLLVFLLVVLFLFLLFLVSLSFRWDVMFVYLPEAVLNKVIFSVYVCCAFRGVVVYV